MTRRAWLFALMAGLSLQTTAAQEPGWVSLFDGQTLNGWQPSERPESWAVEDGAIVTRGNRSHLFYMGEVANHVFRNFEFAAEVMTTPGSNSGIYVHTSSEGPGFPPSGYELQVINSNPQAPPGAYVEHKMTGSIYAVRNTWVSSVPDNEWFEYRIRVSGKTIQTFINGDLICQYTEPADPFRPADKRGRLLGSGTFALQAHDPNSVVHYRGLRVRLLPDDAASIEPPVADKELDDLITQLSNDNYPLIDFGLVAGTGREAQILAREARRYGVTLGSDLPVAALDRHGRSIVIVNDREQAPDPEFLKSAKAAGARIAFSSGGATTIDEARLKWRLQAIKAAGLVWQDFWVPGKP